MSPKLKIRLLLPNVCKCMFPCFIAYPKSVGQVVLWGDGVHFTNRLCQLLATHSFWSLRWLIRRCIISWPDDETAVERMEIGTNSLSPQI